MLRRRMGRLPTCSQHGLAFDPSVSTGCVLCRQATQSSGPVSVPAVRPRTLITLGILLVLTGSGVLLAREESHSTTEVATNNPVTTTASSPLSAPTALSSDPLQIAPAFSPSASRAAQAPRPTSRGMSNPIRRSRFSTEVSSSAASAREVLVEIRATACVTRMRSRYPEKIRRGSFRRSSGTKARA
jgi:hypothetical protein